MDPIKMLRDHTFVVATCFDTLQILSRERLTFRRSGGSTIGSDFHFGTRRDFVQRFNQCRKDRQRERMSVPRSILFVIASILPFAISSSDWTCIRKVL